MATLQDLTKSFGDQCDLVAMIGWDVDEDPGVLVRGHALVRSESFLRDVYPEGFFVLDQPFTRALMIDFDEHEFYADLIDVVAD